MDLIQLILKNFTAKPLLKLKNLDIKMGSGTDVIPSKLIKPLGNIRSRLVTEATDTSLTKMFFPENIQTVPVIPHIPR